MFRYTHVTVRPSISWNGPRPASANGCGEDRVAAEDDGPIYFHDANDDIIVMLPAGASITETPSMTGTPCGRATKNSRQYGSSIRAAANDMRKSRVAPKSFYPTHTCPACGYKIQLKDLLRVDGVNIRCPVCEAETPYLQHKPHTTS
jgi:predicted RNA-binding Zn-ribbon protein involved in translation (DUF1610 family)